MIKQKACEFEPQTIRAVKSNITNDEISAHLKSCAGCREAAKVAAFFQANIKTETPPLPAAGFIWWKSKIIEKRRRAESVGQPLLVAQIAAAAVFFAALVWFFNSNFAQSNSFDAALDGTLASVQSFVAPLAAAIACFAFLCLLFVLALRRYFTEK